MFRRALFLIASLAGSASFAGQMVFLDLHREAVLDHAEVTLSEIADVFTRNDELARLVGRVTVAHCASLANNCRLEKSSLAAIVEEQTKKLGAQIIWSANESVLIKGRTRTLSLTPVIDSVAVGIVRTLGSNIPLAIKVLAGPTSIDIPIGITEIQPRIEQTHRTGTILELPLLVLVDGTIVANPMIRYEVRPAIKQLTIGSAQQTMGAIDGSSGGFPKNNDIRSAKAGVENKNLRGSASSRSHHVVEKDQTVRLMIESGMVRVEAEGVVLTAGEIGDLVKVKRANGLAEVSGRVLDHGTVLVLEN